MVNYYTSVTPVLRGQPIYIQFSNHKELKTDSSPNQAVRGGACRLCWGDAQGGLGHLPAHDSTCCSPTACPGSPAGGELRTVRQSGPSCFCCGCGRWHGHGRPEPCASDHCGEPLLSRDPGRPPPGEAAGNPPPPHTHCLAGPPRAEQLSLPRSSPSLALSSRSLPSPRTTSSKRCCSTQTP